MLNACDVTSLSLRKKNTPSTPGVFDANWVTTANYTAQHPPASALTAGPQDRSASRKSNALNTDFQPRLVALPRPSPSPSRGAPRWLS